MDLDIKLFNTLSDKKEVFKPLIARKAGMYHCGPTVYDYAHIGNMRSYIFADIIRRTFELNGYNVKQVINITDVGHLTGDGDVGTDKIEKAAKEKKTDASEITHKFYDAFIEDLHKLNIKTEDTIFPWASKHIEEQISIIRTLEERGYTYTTSDGVYFDTARFPEYGKLGNIDIENLKEGARIGVNEEKKNLTDFALWKFSPAGEKRLQEWNSPWGIGFPGWHIECSAMSMKYLGETFDIHTGGIDHIPVHHNNEIAQSECATGKPYVHYWMHNAFIRINGEKISKSLNNFILVDDIAKKSLSPLALRYFYLGARYSTQMDFTWEALEDSNRSLEKLNRWYNNLPVSNGLPHDGYKELFIQKINDDFDTPGALAILWQMNKDTEISDEDKYTTATYMNSVLGILKKNDTRDSEFNNEIKNLIEERNEARINKNWKMSDELRSELESRGVEVEDTSHGSEYRNTKHM